MSHRHRHTRKQKDDLDRGVIKQRAAKMSETHPSDPSNQIIGTMKTFKKVYMKPELLHAQKRVANARSSEVLKSTKSVSLAEHQELQSAFEYAPSQNSSDTRHSKMYVNPKFLKMNILQDNEPVRPAECAKPDIQKSSVYINPNFQGNISVTAESSVPTKAKSSVYVNPKVFTQIIGANLQGDVNSEVLNAGDNRIAQNVQNIVPKLNTLPVKTTVGSRKYVYCSKELIKQKSQIGSSSNADIMKGSIQTISSDDSRLKSCSHQLSLKTSQCSQPLMAVSRTKMIRAQIPPEIRLKNLLINSSSVAGSSSKQKIVRRPSFNSSVVSLSRTKLVRVPNKQRTTVKNSRDLSVSSNPVPSSRLKLKSPHTVLVSKTKLVRSSRRRSGYLPLSSRQMSLKNQKQPDTALLSVSRTKMVRSPLKSLKSGTFPNRIFNSNDRKMSTSGKISRKQTVLGSRIRRLSFRASTPNVVIKAAKAVRSKYNIIKSPPVTSRNDIIGQIRESRFKVDRRIQKGPTNLSSLKKYNTQRNEQKYISHKYRYKNVCTSSRRRYCNRTWTSSFTPKKVLVTSKKLMRIGKSPVLGGCKGREKGKNSCLVRIGGVLYKSSKLKLTRSQSPKEKNHIKNEGYRNKRKPSSFVVSVRGNKFLMDPLGKKLERITQEEKHAKEKKTPVRRIDIGGVTFIQKSTNVLIRTNTHNARTVVSQAKQKSIAMLTSKLRKNNQPCMFYHRFGKCVRKDKGTCPHIHDPKQVAICKKFLQGCCEITDCTLSHDVVPEKMPTCKYFLEGCCVRDNCPYLHVKVNAKAAICRNFLHGYCQDGVKCKKRHTYICPDFEKTGICSKGKYCPYPHKTVVVKKVKQIKCKGKKKQKTLAPSERKRYYDTVRTPSREEKFKEMEDPPKASMEAEREIEAKRLKLLKKVDNMKRNWLMAQPCKEASSLTLPEMDAEASTSFEVKRPKIGTLPAYIPLDKDP